MTTDFTSRWFADDVKKGQHRDYVEEDVKIRKLLSQGMERAGIAKVDWSDLGASPRIPYRSPGHRHRSSRRRSGQDPR